MKIEKIKPIPKYILARIKKADAQNNATLPHQTRFYAYLTKNDGELVKVTVAVKYRYKNWLYLFDIRLVEPEITAVSRVFDIRVVFVKHFRNHFFELLFGCNVFEIFAQPVKRPIANIVFNAVLFGKIQRGKGVCLRLFATLRNRFVRIASARSRRALVQRHRLIKARLG